MDVSLAYQNRTHYEEITHSSYSYNLNYTSQSAPPISTDQNQGPVSHGCQVQPPPPPYSPCARPVSQAWTIPVPVNDAPSEPPPPYSAVDSNFYVPAQQNPVPGARVDDRTITTTSSTTTNARPRQRIEKPISIKSEYLTSKFAFLKIFEFIISLVGFSTCSSFQNSAGIPMEHADRSSFFVLLLVVCWLFSGVIFWLNLIGFLSKYDTKANFFKMIVIHGILSFLLFIASLLLAGMKICTLYHNSSCQTYRTAVACGFIDLALFATDTVVQYHKFKQR